MRQSVNLADLALGRYGDCPNILVNQKRGVSVADLMLGRAGDAPRIEIEKGLPRGR